MANTYTGKRINASTAYHPSGKKNRNGKTLRQGEYVYAREIQPHKDQYWSKVTHSPLCSLTEAVKRRMQALRDGWHEVSEIQCAGLPNWVEEQYYFTASTEV